MSEVWKQEAQKKKLICGFFFLMFIYMWAEKLTEQKNPRQAKSTMEINLMHVFIFYLRSSDHKS